MFQCIAQVSLLLAATLLTSTACGQPASLLPSSRGGAAKQGVAASLPTASTGGFVAAHFAGRMDAGAVAARAREIANRGPELAGVRHALIVAGSDGDARAAVNGLGNAAPRSVADPDGTLANQVARTPLAADGSNAGFPITVLLDGRGQVVQTLRGGDDQWVPLESLAAQVTMRNRVARTDLVNLAGDVAAAGYDVVSYRDGAPRPGQPALRSSWQGIAYQFADADSRRRFADDPAAFAPAVGGWCVAAMAEGERVAPSPATFLIVDNQLCLFAEGTSPEVLARWRSNGRAELQRAVAQWKRLGGS